MQSNERRNDHLKRCFVVAPQAAEAAQIAKVLNERGVECLHPDRVVETGGLSEEIFKYLASADFVIASLHGNITPNVAFELGAAYAFGKPTLIFTTNYDRLFDSLRDVYLVKATPYNTQEFRGDIDRFLRHAVNKHTSSVTQPKTTIKTTISDNLTWARERLSAIKSDRDTNKSVIFENLIYDILKDTGAQLSQGDCSSPVLVGPVGRHLRSP